MSTPETPFTAIYAQWLETFRALIPGGAPAGPSEALTPRQEQAAANQEWEDEGGSIKPVPTSEVKDAPKIPF
jgi:hypothetical protein